MAMSFTLATRRLSCKESLRVASVNDIAIQGSPSHIRGPPLHLYIYIYVYIEVPPLCPPLYACIRGDIRGDKGG
jgi:hypothetical protein